MTDGLSEQSSQLRGEDGRFVSATPPTDAPQPGPQAGAAADATPTPAGVAPAGDVYAAVATRMNAAARAADSNSQPAVAADRPTPPTPATDAAPPGQTTADAAANPPSSSSTSSGQAPSAGSGQAPSTSSGQAPPAPAPTAAADAADLKAYGDTLSKREMDLLKSVPGMLVTPDEWRGMSGTERMEHIQDVRAIRNERNRQYQQTNDRGGRPPQGAAAPNDRTTPETGPTPRAGGTLEGDGVSVPRQPPSGLTLPAQVQEALAAVAAEFGADSSVYRLQQQVALQNAELAQRLEQQDRQRQSEAQARAADRQIRQFEDAQFQQLQAKYPDLSNPTTRDEIRQAARDYYALRQSQGRPVEDREALRFVTHNTLYPKIQAQQQQQAQANRQRSLAGTFDRATSPTPPATAADRRAPARSEDDAYASVASRLNRTYAGGVSPGEAARRSARALAG